MKRITLPFIVAFSLFSVHSNGQVGINTSTPASTLEITAKNATGSNTNIDGLLIPRVDRERAQNMTTAPTSTLIYVNALPAGTQTGVAINIDAVGYYFFDGTSWVKLKTNLVPDVNIYNADGSLTGNRLVTQGTNTLAFSSNAVNGFSVDGSTLSVDALNNRVGIGTTTPHGPLQFANAVVNRKIVMYETGDNDHEFYGFGVNSGILRYQADRTTTDHVFFAAVTGGASSNELMRIKGTGNVGIGTSTPGVRLDVAQPIGTSEATQLRIINTSPVALNNTAYIGFNSYNAGGATWGIGSVQNSTNVTDSNFHILYSNGGNYLKRFTVRPNGDIGINTTAPTSMLSVNGTADKVGGGTWNTFSDSRMKKNVQPYTKGLPEILKINTVTFQYNGKGGYSEDGKTYTGVIAQEIEKILPTTVTKIKSDDFSDQRQYDSSELTYTLINAIKEQQKLIEEQNKKIKELQADVSALKAK
ncbi:tail fiber domain-containing protein [Chryseobacterium sp. SIMBA_038]|uniref:tail fiber domain-containing protein n=1 Tax=Chryseobacterium sp. SIMBA_038 TaxID=3085780 RepID=UPI00397BB7E3